MEDRLYNIRKAAYRLLNYQWYSCYQMEEKLLKKGFAREPIKEVLEGLKKERLLDDRRFAEMWITDRREAKGLGRKRLYYELQQKGIEQEIIQTELNHYSEEEEKAIAWQVVQQKFQEYASLEKEKRQSKVVGFLGRKGFSFSIIKQIISLLESGES